ncbi:MAG: quinone oxidoreductase [Chloroflexota bacterium]|nr:quinone oxidoreductase [Chloroflexota bacterium]
MKAIRVHEFGGPEVMKFEDVPLPEPGEGEARVRIEAAGLNYIDTYHRTGLYPVGLPMTPGMEGAGVVDTIGPGVVGVMPGDRVAYCMALGAYADYAIVPSSKLVPLPAAVSSEAAAAALLQGMTAHYLALSTYPLTPGDRALVHAAAGGVGLLLVQIAKIAGATVYGTVSTEEKAQLAREAGADEVILYSKMDFEQAIMDLTDGQGVDVVYDSVGQSTFEKSLNCLRPRGLLALFGQSSGPVPPVDLQILNQKGSLFITRPTLGHYVIDRNELMSRAGDVLMWMTEGSLDVRIDRTMPLSEAAEAHRLLQGRKTAGKVLLLPWNDIHE